jgi:hypothetical protein
MVLWVMACEFGDELLGRGLVVCSGGGGLLRGEVGGWVVTGGFEGFVLRGEVHVVDVLLEAGGL